MTNPKDKKSRMNQKTVVSSVRPVGSAVSKPIVVAEEKKDQKENQERAIQEKTKNAVQVSNWMIALGLGALVAVTVASTVYYVKRRRQKKARSMYFGEEEEETVESYQQKLNRYWGLTTRLFNGVKTSVLGILSREKDTTSPTQSTSNVNMKMYGSKSDNGPILDEAEL